MKRLSLLILLLCAAGLAVAGCGKDMPTEPASSGSSDTQTFNSLMDQEPALAEGETYEAPEREFAEASAGADADAGLASGSFSTTAAIRPLAFYRVIRERSRSLDVHTEEDSTKVTAIVEVTDRLAGSFNLVVADSTDSGVVRRLIRKPLRDVGRFRAAFVRWKRPSPDDPDAPETVRSLEDWTRWRLAAISGRVIHSPENTAKIVSLRLHTETGVDVTIDDPLALRRFPRGLIAVTANTRVDVEVRVSDPTDAVFLLAGWGHQRLRRSGDVFVGSFRAPYDLRLFRFGVNVLDHATLFTDDGPYDSDFWGIPARTVPLSLTTS